MPEYRRVYVEGGTYFFTVVTYKRFPIFQDEQAISLLNESIQHTMDILPFQVATWVILPDHLHAIWVLPEGDSDYSTRWKKIKSYFTRRFEYKNDAAHEYSRLRKGEKNVWQRRYWEHLIKDQNDFNRHCDYIHYNPVKHGLVNSPAEYECSSFNEFVNRGVYEPDWGESLDNELIHMDLE